MKLSEHFTTDEFRCTGASPAIVGASLQVANYLELIRVEPMTIMSAYRTPEHNRRVGGSPTSDHMKGLAVDVTVHEESPTQLAERAREVWEAAGVKWDQIILYPRHVHFGFGKARRKQYFLSDYK